MTDIAEKVLPRPDLTDIPYVCADMTMFVDGSSRKNLDGTNATGYAVVTTESVLSAKALPRHYSAQAAELIALTEECKIAKEKVVNIYTDSQYAFSTVHVFAQQWKNRGMVTSTGKPINHKELILNLLDAIQLPKKLAICKCAAHTRGTDYVSVGNHKADEEAKKAAQLSVDMFLSKPQETYLDQQVLKDMQMSASAAEKEKWKNKGAQIDKNTGLYM